MLASGFAKVLVLHLCIASPPCDCGLLALLLGAPS